MNTPRNAAPAQPPAPVPTGMPLPVRRVIGATLLGGTMWIAGLLALWRAVVGLF
ncbi:MAG TPA: hypothetical protein VD970_06995 [Acetobacteraceae bacterium]|nr:hypothetical protein [Acetobacteraceae bacterium]